MTAAISTVDHRMENDTGLRRAPEAFPATLRHRRCFAADDSPATLETFHHKRSLFVLSMHRNLLDEASSLT